MQRASLTYMCTQPNSFVQDYFTRAFAPLHTFGRFTTTRRIHPCSTLLPPFHHQNLEIRSISTVYPTYALFEMKSES